MTWGWLLVGILALLALCWIWEKITGEKTTMGDGPESGV